MTDFDFSIDSISFIWRDRITRTRPYISPAPRTHHSLVFVTDGVLLYTVGDATFRVESGSVLLILSGETDVSSSEGDSVGYIYFNFDGTLPPVSQDTLRRINRPTNRREILALFTEALELWSTRAFAHKPSCKSLLGRIIARLAECNFSGTEGYYKQNRIRPAILALESDYASPLSVAQLALLCSMSAGNLTRLFGELLGCSPIEYLTRVRIENAKRLLRTGAYNISEVAERCGFASIYSFSRAFKRICGVAPSLWRG